LYKQNILPKAAYSICETVNKTQFHE
jgi:hypothetical protein